MIKKILIFSIVLLGLIMGVNSYAKSYYYHLIEVDITVNQDSTFDVVERQTYKLDGSFGYFYRDIELKGLDHISDIKVFDSDDNELEEDEYDLSYNGNRRHIQWNFNRRDFNDELKSWTVAYKVHGGLGFFKNYDELYWNAIFADRTVKVLFADVRVHLPENVEKSEIGQKIFIGQSGDTAESSNYEILSDGVLRYMGVNLNLGEYLTIVASWPKGLIEKPFLYRNQTINWIALLLALILPFSIIRRSYRDWKEKGKDPKIDKTVIAQYEPPQDLTPGVVGILDDQRFSVKEVTATLVDLAVRGYIKIKEGEKKFLGQREYIFEKLKEGDDLKTFEKRVMKGMFVGSSLKIGNIGEIFKVILNKEKRDKFLKKPTQEKNIISSNDLRNKFYKSLKEIKEELHKEAVKTGYLTGNIENIRKKFQSKYGVLVISGIVMSFVSFILFVAFGPIVVGLIFISIGILISGITGTIFGYYMPSLTKQGADEKWKWLGFKEYLHTAERFRLGAETVDTFSKYLPYAIIFGVEKQWADRFADLKYQQPNWYVPAVIHSSGSGGVGSGSFSGLSSSISSFSTSISNTFASSPGGSGGGGSAGGGGGGGGGGAG